MFQLYVKIMLFQLRAAKQMPLIGTKIHSRKNAQTTNRNTCEKASMLVESQSKSAQTVKERGEKAKYANGTPSELAFYTVYGLNC